MCSRISKYFSVETLPENSNRYCLPVAYQFEWKARFSIGFLTADRISVKVLNDIQYMN